MKDELISTLVSPLLKKPKAALAGFWPRRLQILSTRAGCEEPEKTCVCLMAANACGSTHAEELGWWLGFFRILP